MLYNLLRRDCLGRRRIGPAGKGRCCSLSGKTQGPPMGGVPRRCNVHHVRTPRYPPARQPASVSTAVASALELARPPVSAFASHTPVDPGMCQPRFSTQLRPAACGTHRRRDVRPIPLRNYTTLVSPHPFLSIEKKRRGKKRKKKNNFFLITKECVYELHHDSLESTAFLVAAASPLCASLIGLY